MKVKPEGSLREALLKGCLWMVENGGSSEGGQNEAGQQPTLQHQRCPTAQPCDEELSKSSFA